MISQKHRFHGYGSLRTVYKNGQTIHGTAISLRVGKRDERKQYRVAVVVSKKVSKSAVVRNRIRRRIYEQVRQQGTGIPGGCDLVFTVFSDQLAELDADKLAKTISALLQKLPR